MELFVDGELTEMGIIILVSYFIFLIILPNLVAVFVYIRELLKRHKLYLKCKGYCVGIQYLGASSEIENGADFLYVFDYEIENQKYKTERKKDGCIPFNSTVTAADMVNYAPVSIGQDDEIIIWVNKSDIYDTYISRFDGLLSSKVRNAYGKTFLFSAIMGLLSMAGAMLILVLSSIG